MWKFWIALLVGCTGGGQSPPSDGNNPGDDGGDTLCAEDAFEPNDTTAFATGVGETLDRITMIAELCPTGDVDLFSLVIGAGLVFEATLASEDGTLLDFALLLGEGSVTIADGEPTGVPGEVRISIPSTPDLGRVVVRVGGNGKQAYRLALDLRP